MAIRRHFYPAWLLVCRRRFRRKVIIFLRMSIMWLLWQFALSCFCYRTLCVSCNVIGFSSRLSDVYIEERNPQPRPEAGVARKALRAQRNNSKQRDLRCCWASGRGIGLSPSFPKPLKSRGAGLVGPVDLGSVWGSLASRRETASPLRRSYSRCNSLPSICLSAQDEANC